MISGMSSFFVPPWRDQQKQKEGKSSTKFLQTHLTTWTLWKLFCKAISTAITFLTGTKACIFCSNYAKERVKQTWCSLNSSKTWSTIQISKPLTSSQFSRRRSSSGTKNTCLISNASSLPFWPPSVKELNDSTRIISISKGFTTTTR